MHRFFVSVPLSVGQPVTLVGDQAHQVRRVLRMRPPEHVLLLDGHSGVFEAELVAVKNTGVTFQVVRRQEATGEPATHITLYQAVLKGERFGWALQKGVEVGISAFVPLVCERNIVNDTAAIEGKRPRWEQIIREAAEQCGRSRLPVLQPAQLFKQAVKSPPPVAVTTEGIVPEARGRPASGPLRLIPWEGERQMHLRAALVACNVASAPGIQIFVGPEGGFTAEEIALARHYGIQTVTLGPRILRAETAGVIAAALILYEMGDL